MRVAYEGTDFCGFARQADGLRTVQSELDRVLSTVYGAPIYTRGASRTDSGVHAMGQMVAFEAPVDAGLPPERLVQALWGELPPDLSVIASWGVQPLDDRPLHPRYHALGKHYRYRIRSTRVANPITGRFEWHFRRPLDVGAMRAAAKLLEGRHDFAAFRAGACQAKSTVRRIQSVSISESDEPMGFEHDKGGPPAQGGPPVVLVDVHGEAFLMHMVRIMVGTLTEVGLGRQAPEWVHELFDAPARAKAGPTAPASGLTLVQVKWPESWPPPTED